LKLFAGLEIDSKLVEDDAFSAQRVLQNQIGEILPRLDAPLFGDDGLKRDQVGRFAGAFDRPLSNFVEQRG
jgi:hypothetical protein